MEIIAHTNLNANDRIRAHDAVEAAARVTTGSRLSVVYERSNGGTTTVAGDVRSVFVDDDGQLHLTFRRDDDQLMWIAQDNSVHTRRARHTRVGALLEITIDGVADPLPTDPRTWSPISSAVVMYRKLDHDYPARGAKNVLDAIARFEERGGTPDLKDELIDAICREKERQNA